MSGGLIIRPATADDARAIWTLVEPVVRQGETLTLDRNLGEAEAIAYWFGEDKEAYVGEQSGAIVGTYYLRANQTGGGDHVCNCGYITAEHARGRGVARALCLHSLDRARKRGFRAMQFNFVVSTNDCAVRLWSSLGFAIVGVLPKVFHHPTQGYVDAFVMFQTL